MKGEKIQEPLFCIECKHCIEDSGKWYCNGHSRITNEIDNVFMETDLSFCPLTREE